MHLAELSFSNKVKEIGYRCYDFESKNIILQVAINQVISRLVMGILMTPAAILDFAVHSFFILTTPFCCLGIPWDHIARVRQAVLPMLLGSLLSLVHPLAGLYISEPKQKHIAHGILSGGFTACSPVTTLEEFREIGQSLPKEHCFDPELKTILTTALKVEKQAERIQSMRLFAPKIGFKTLALIVMNLDSMYRNSPVLFFIASRVAVLTYPIFFTLDLLLNLTFLTLAAFTGLIQWVGIPPPIYLEETAAPHVLLYNVIQVIWTLLTSPLIWVVGLVSPEKAYNLENWASNVCVKSQVGGFIKEIQEKARSLDIGQTLLLPVLSHNYHSFFVTPFSSHITYLLIEKKEEGFVAERIDRSSNRKQACTTLMDEKTCFELIQGALEMRFEMGNKDYDGHFKEPASIELEDQPGSATNCVVYNLYGAIETWRAKKKQSFAIPFRDAVNRVVKKRYGYLLKDYHFAR